MKPPQPQLRENGELKLAHSPFPHHPPRQTVIRFCFAFPGTAICEHALADADAVTLLLLRLGRFCGSSAARLAEKGENGWNERCGSCKISGAMCSDNVRKTKKNELRREAAVSRCFVVEQPSWTTLGNSYH